jgi:hypothetical protein
MLREYTGSITLLRRYIGHHAVNTKLTPQLDLLVFAIQEELLETASKSPLVTTGIAPSNHTLTEYVKSFY